MHKIIYIENIKTFGNIYIYDNKIFKLKKNINEKKEENYTITGENNNILTKTRNDSIRVGIICENILEKDREYKWKIKILKTKNYNFMVGVAPNDYYEQEKNASYKYGWFFSCDNQRLYSGLPFNYDSKTTNLKKPKNEIIVIMNMIKRTLKFLVDNEDKGDSYKDIPLDKPLSPALLIYDEDDSLEIINYED